VGTKSRGKKSLDVLPTYVYYVGMTSTATSRRRPTAAKAKAATPAKALTNAEQNAEIGERLIEMIRTSGTLVWHSPYLASSGLPRSLSSRKSYSGINTWLLAGTAMEQGYDSPWWGTYRQISDLGGQVRKGESSTRITFWKILERTEADATGKPVTKKGCGAGSPRLQPWGGRAPRFSGLTHCADRPRIA
jgi:antirestriction protein ArdC